MTQSICARNLYLSAPMSLSRTYKSKFPAFNVQWSNDRKLLSPLPISLYLTFPVSRFLVMYFNILFFPRFIIYSWCAYSEGDASNFRHRTPSLPHTHCLFFRFSASLSCSAVRMLSWCAFFSFCLFLCVTNAWAHTKPAEREQSREWENWKEKRTNEETSENWMKEKPIIRKPTNIRSQYNLSAKTRNTTADSWCRYSAVSSLILFSFYIFSIFDRKLKIARPIPSWQK